MSSAHEFRIPDYLPLTLNELLRSHWSVRSKAQKEADAFVAYYSRLAHIPGASRRRKVSLTFHGGLADPDARLKLILDALVHNLLLVDDSEEWCLVDPPKNGPGPKAVAIRLEDIPPLVSGAEERGAVGTGTPDH